MAIVSFGRMDAGMAKKIKILAISYLYPNSVYPDYGIFVHNRLKAVSKSCDVVVINPVPWFPFSFLFEKYKNFNKIPSKENVDGMTLYHPKFFMIPRYLKWIDSISFCICLFPLILRIKKSFVFDLIDVHWTYPDILSGWFYSKLLRKKKLITIRGKEALSLSTKADHQNKGYQNGSSYYKEISPRALITRTFLRFYDCVITLSQELKCLCVELGVEGQRAKVITNGIDLEKFYLIDQKKVREKLNISPKTFVILSVGSLIFRKGFDRLLKILPELRAVNPSVEIYIIGSEGPEGAYKSQLDRICEENEMVDNVHYVGQVRNSELVMWYNAADIFCLSSRGEGSPNVLYEALGCGCPSISTDVGSAAEILCHKKLGKIIPNTNQALLSALKFMMLNSYSRQGIADYMKNHDWDVCGQKVIKEYKLLLNI